MNPEIINSFTPLEILLIGALVALVGGIVTLARYLYLFMKSTNKERAEEIRKGTEVQAKLVHSIEANCQMIQQLPERLADKIQLAAQRK